MRSSTRRSTIAGWRGRTETSRSGGPFPIGPSEAVASSRTNALRSTRGILRDLILGRGLRERGAWPPPSFFPKRGERMSMKRVRFLKLFGAFCGCVLVLVLAPVAPAGQGKGQLRSTGVVTLSKVPTAVGSTASGPRAGEVSRTPEIESQVSNALHKRHGKPSSTPNPAGLPVVTSNPGASGFDGLNHV